uniref:Uncharacterized protein n=1 Tax=Anopheles quadriannulatus TaxID=34691 RepID=A0A182XR11_ANOQN
MRAVNFVKKKFNTVPSQMPLRLVRRLESSLIITHRARIGQDRTRKLWIALTRCSFCPRNPTKKKIVHNKQHVPGIILP